MLISGSEVARVTFSETSPVPKFLNPAPKFFQFWESDFCSNSANYQCNRNSTMCVIKQWHLNRPRRLLLLAKIKSDSWYSFSQIIDSGSEWKHGILPESTPDPWPPLVVFCHLPEVCMDWILNFLDPDSTRGVAYMREGAARWSTQLRRECWVATGLSRWMGCSDPQGSGHSGHGRESINPAKMKLCPGCHYPFASRKLYKLFAVLFLHLDDGWFGTLGIQSAEM